MSEKNGEGCLGCLGSLAVLTLVGSLFFGGGVLYRVGSWSISLGRYPVDRQSIMTSYWNKLENDKRISDQSSQIFRTQLEKGEHQAVYNQASEPFKKNLTLSQWIDNCKIIKQSLGSMKSSQLMDIWVQPTDKDEEQYILVRYLTIFEKVSTQESFVWMVKDSKPELIQYQILPVNQVIEKRVQV